MSAEAWVVFAVVYIAISLAVGGFLLANSKVPGSWIFGVIWPVLLLLIAAMWIVTRFIPEPTP